MVSYLDLTDRSAVEWAVAECDRIGRDSFLAKYGFGEAKTYFLVTETGRYDSKAIFGAAYERQHGVPLSSDDLSGGKSGAAGRLAELGFDIEDIDDRAGRLTFSTFDEALMHFRMPMENIPLVREFVTQRPFIEFYIPRSGTYIAAVPESGSGVGKAFIHSGYIWHRVAKGEGESIELPVNRIRDGGYMRGAKREEPKEVCSSCFLELPSNGSCPFC